MATTFPQPGAASIGAAMRNLLQDADRDRLVAPLAPLARAAGIGGRPHRALAEAEGSSFLPVEANARAAELLLLPGIRDADPATADAILDFLMAMADAPMPCRRAVAAGLEAGRDDPRDVDVSTAFWRLGGDLGRGELTQTLRGGRAAIRHGGNMVEFRAGRFATCADVEDAVVEQSVTRQDGRILLRHVSAIRGKAGWLWGSVAEAGRLAVTYEVTPGSPVLRVTASFTASRRLDRVRLTLSADALDEGGLGATAARIEEDGAWRDMAMPAAPGGSSWSKGRPVSRMVIGAVGWPEGAPVLDLRPADPARVMSVTAEARQAGAVHWLIPRHGFVTLAAGETLTVSEDRYLGPALPDGAAAAALEGMDLDAAPPSGAVLQAVAAALFFAGTWQARMPEDRRAALAAFAERHFARIEAAAPDAMALAEAAVALDSLRRAGIGWAASAQARVVAQLAGMLDEKGVVSPLLPAQAMAALAFARAAGTVPEAMRALERALDAVGVPLSLADRPIDATQAEGLALLARAAGAAVLAAEAGLQVAPGTIERGRALHRAAVNLLRPMVQPRGGALVVQGPQGFGPGLQAMATLALLAPERLVLTRQTATA
ncbi:hypothetical protein [Falsiroseomonas sp. HW251]|uniref:hypothetical protein n=1 Tax=Falsiroseomonas sp. HW251 TaxID=3390998 RepID=UPI003D32096F